MWTPRSSFTPNNIPIAPLSDLGRAVSHPLRHSILRTLAESPRHVDALARDVGSTASSVSRHLGILLGMGLVCIEKVKKMSVYRLSPRVVSHVHEKVLCLSTVSAEGTEFELRFTTGQSILAALGSPAGKLHGRVSRINI